MDLKKYLNQNVNIIIDRPLGSKHPEHGFIYESNYGYIPDTKAPDGEEIDAYLLGSDKPVMTATGKCIAIINRENDDDNKLVIALPSALGLGDEAIMKLVNFQEKWFKSKVVRK